MAKTEPVEEEKKPESIKVFIIALVLVSVIAVGGGWIVGVQMNAGEATSAEDAAREELAKRGKEEEVNGKGEETDALPDSDKNVVELDTILVALRDNDNIWVRLQLAVISDSQTDLDSAEIKTRMHSDITAFVKTLKLAQISGPSGFIHLKEDLLDRARLTTNGQVEDLMIMSIIAE
ncbi:MAG: flagellar basal body-associated FliL family protein [Hyphomicrobiales bacterium]|nr:flagellar basal body-associated FliL family protein [Hyphomicrobiales bacterium]